MAVVGGDGPPGRKSPPPGPRGPPPTPTKSWSSIASLNISKRNKTNSLEVRLENDEGKGCFLNDEEIERLLRRLNIKANQFTSVQACPERRNVVYITLINGIDITKFITNSNESYVLKQGIRTTSIKPINKREVNVLVFGLHPDTKDEAVIRYLTAHGKVNIKQPVTYGVYPGVSGSSLLAGKRNGNRIYSMEVMRNIGSTHIIDGEKVSIRYPGQTKTCNKCHQQAHLCSGKGLAKDCSSDKILLSQHMIAYWKQINFNPETTDMNEVDDMENDEVVPVTVDQVKHKPKNVVDDSDMTKRYGGVVIKGYKKETDINDVVETLKEAGLPFDYDKADLHITEKFGKLTIYIHDLKSETCIEIINNLNDEAKSGNKLSVYSLVEDTPTKNLGKELEKLIDADENPSNETKNLGKEFEKLIEADENPSNETLNTPVAASAPGINEEFFDNFLNVESESSKGKLWANQIDDLNISDDSSDDNMDDLRESFKKKRKAAESPDKDDFEKIMSKKEKKKLKQLLNKSS